VKKITGSVTTIYVYDHLGRMVAEYSDSNTVSQASRTSYLTADSLGTPRVLTNNQGAVISRHDYLPFGEEISAGTGGRTVAQGYVADDVRQKFTGKERDDETGLDYFNARYYASTQGRFLSIDPIPVTKENFVNPQRWNSYAYVNNNPIAVADPNGCDGQGASGDKVISVFLIMNTDDRNYKINTKTLKTTYEKGPDWQGMKGQVGNEYKLALYGTNDVTGENNRFLPDMMPSGRDFEYALKNSEVVAYVDHGDGSTTDAQGNPTLFIPTYGIRVGQTQYQAGGTISFDTGLSGAKPETNATVVLNFSCNSVKNTDFFNLTGNGTQYVIGIDSGRSGNGGTGIGTMEKAAAAFIKAYTTTKGTVDQRVNAGISAAQKVISSSTIDADQGDRVVVARVVRR
jgi:RHS repeat-associated protein